MRSPRIDAAADQKDDLAAGFASISIAGMMTPVFLAAALVLPAPLMVQASGTAPPAESTPPAAEPAPALPRVTLETALGRIVIELETARAPLSTAAFLRYVGERRLDGTGFYRALDLGRGYGLVQFGTRNDRARTLPPIAHEPTSATGLSHTSGAISLARGAPGTAAGDFFIVVGDLVALDAQPPESGADPDGYAVFGRVVEGMDVIRAILTQPIDPEAGEGTMRGQMLASPVTINSARRHAEPAP